MTTYDIYFHTLSHDYFGTPYIRDSDTVVYECDGKEGTIAFNGYYYVENGLPPYPEDLDETIKPWEKPRRYSECLPKKVFMSLTHREKKPYKTEQIGNGIRQYYNELEKQFYKIEIYKMELYESTDEISEIQDEDGEPMSICFFPTNMLKLWFRVIEDMHATIMPKHILYTPYIMPKTLYATKESYEHILRWGQNSTDEWYHPVSRSQFAQGLHSVNVGDQIEFILDGLTRGIQVLEIGTIYDYPLLKHVNGDFNISNLLVDRVIRVKGL